MYQPPLIAAESQWSLLQRFESSKSFASDGSLQARAALIAALPHALLRKMAQRTSLNATIQRGDIPFEEIGHRLGAMPQYKEVLRAALAASVRSSSRRQAALGLISAGALKSVKYVWNKVKKSWRSR